MKSRGLSIFLYILSFFFVFFITGVISIHAYYFIPYSSDGIQTDRAFPISYLIVFGLISVVFAFLMAYSFLSRFGKYSYKEVFDINRKKMVFISSVLTFGLVFFMAVLLIGYIILNIGDPNSFIDGNNSNSINITADKSFTNINYNNMNKKTNMFTVKGDYTLSFTDSHITHYGSGEYKKVGINSIINASENAHVFGDRLMLTVKGHYTEGIYLDNSKLILNNSNILIEGNYSVALFGNNSEMIVSSTTINSNSNYLCVFRNGSNVIFDSTNFIIGDRTNHVFYLTSDSMDTVNKFTLRGSIIDTPVEDLFKIESSNNILSFEKVTFDWKNSEYYLIDINKSNVVLNIKDSKLAGNIYINEDSNLKINMENSEFFGDVIGHNNFELTMDEESTFNSNLDIKLDAFYGTDEAFKNVNSFGNHVYIGTDIKK